MAERFGGKFSPERPSGAQSGPQSGLSNLLFIAPLPLVFSAFGDGADAFALNLGALALLLLAAWLTREGVRAQAEFEARKVARAPAFPRKLVGSVLIGAGLAVASFAAGNGLFAPLTYGVIGAALHLFSFGLDPMKNKGMEGIDSYQSDRVARAVDGAEEHLSAMSDAILRAKDRGMEKRVAEFQKAARVLFRTVEDDPRDLTAARKYLSVYLRGARDATIKFADINARKPDPQARADYEALLSDLETNFAARNEAMLLDDRSDLNIEIEVLRERLQREGVRTTRDA